ncbi:MAG: peptidase M10, partial [Deltaproteobacteria bacterium]|nr:peptidase M10 [Deltaproteobacteria bacterium]MBW2532720.1 peptidase M10 [Deltaproteobacteria bacterium]
MPLQTSRPVWVGAVVLGGVLAGAACASSDEPRQEARVGSGTMTFEQFLEVIDQEPDTGIYIVDGDTPILTYPELVAFYEQYVQTGALIVHQAGGVDAAWDDTQKLALTYCVSASSFGSRYGQVVDAMATAAAAWEAAAHVDFIHRSDQDGDCTSSNDQVLFDVNQTRKRSYLARAFFPNFPRSSRNVLISASAYGSSQPLEGILKHELGHAIGFRHEHTRPEAGTCFEDSSWRPLTPYDSASVMHYPQCNGSADLLALTALDRHGAACLYGQPGTGAPEPGCDDVGGGAGGSGV